MFIGVGVSRQNRSLALCFGSCLCGLSSVCQLSIHGALWPSKSSNENCPLKVAPKGFNTKNIGEKKTPPLQISNKKTRTWNSTNSSKQPVNNLWKGLKVLFQVQKALCLIESMSTSQTVQWHPFRLTIQLKWCRSQQTWRSGRCWSHVPRSI